MKVIKGRGRDMTDRDYKYRETKPIACAIHSLIVINEQEIFVVNE